MLLGFRGEEYMNEELILKMVQPYLKNKKQLSFKDFKKIFTFLSRQEQYLVVDVLIANKIEFLTEQGKVYDYFGNGAVSSSKKEETIDFEIEIPDDVVDNDYEILYDDDLFKDKGVPQSNFVVSYKDVKQSNEILCRLIQQGNEQAKQDLCIKNRALVDKYAWAYGKKYITRLSFDDIEQAGMIGLIKAAERFDWHKRTLFTTYAVWWIRQSVVREIYDTGFIIRLPVHMMEKISKIAKLDSIYIGRGYDSIERHKQISEDLNIPVDYIEYCLLLKTFYLSTSSLNSPVGEEESSELMELIPIENEESIEDILVMGNLREDIEKALLDLSEREQQVLRLRFGFDDGHPRTLEEVGKMFNVTRERIRQIETKALKKLSHPARAKKLKVYLEE